MRTSNAVLGRWRRVGRKAETVALREDRGVTHRMVEKHLRRGSRRESWLRDRNDLDVEPVLVHQSGSDLHEQMTVGVVRTIEESRPSLAAREDPPRIEERVLGRTRAQVCVRRGR